MNIEQQRAAFEAVLSDEKIDALIDGPQIATAHLATRRGNARELMRIFARQVEKAAIELDRQGRGEPAAWEKALRFAEHVRKCLRNDGEYAPLITQDVDEVIAALRAHPAIKESLTVAEPVKVPSKPQIRDIFLANGFAIPHGHDDLKPYVYAAARDLLARYGAPMSDKPACGVQNAECERQQGADKVGAQPVAYGIFYEGVMQSWAWGEDAAWAIAKEDYDNVKTSILPLYTAPVAAQPDPAMAGDEWMKQFEGMYRAAECDVSDPTARFHLSALLDHARNRVQPASGDGDLAIGGPSEYVCCDCGTPVRHGYTCGKCDGFGACTPAEYSAMQQERQP